MSDLNATSVIITVSTAIISAISTIIISKIKNKNRISNFVSITEDSDLKVIHSNRVDLTDKDSVNGRVYKTRKYDRVRSPIKGTVTIIDNKLIIEGLNKTIILAGVMPIVSNGVIVNPSEDVAIVSRIESGEGKIFVSISDNKKDISTDKINND